MSAISATPPIDAPIAAFAPDDSPLEPVPDFIGLVGDAEPVGVMVDGVLTVEVGN